MILDPEYVDVLAGQVIAVELELAQERTLLNAAVREKVLSDPFIECVKRYTDYWNRRGKLSDRVIETAQRHGTWCADAQCLVLVGKEHVLRVKSGEIAVIICAGAETVN